MPNGYEPSESERIDTMDEYENTNAANPDSESSAGALDGQAQGSEGSDSLSSDEAITQTLLVSNEYDEAVLDYLDYINSGVICSIVLLGAILGVLVIRCFLDKVSD